RRVPEPLRVVRAARARPCRGPHPGHRARLLDRSEDLDERRAALPGVACGLERLQLLEQRLRRRVKPSCRHASPLFVLDRSRRASDPLTRSAEGYRTDVRLSTRTL